jgi:hypothetical protein
VLASGQLLTPLHYMTLAFKREVPLLTAVNIRDNNFIGGADVSNISPETIAEGLLAKTSQHMTIVTFGHYQNIRSALKSYRTHIKGFRYGNN